VVPREDHQGCRAVILVSALGYREVACVIGHDFGSVGASMCALMRPDLFKSYVTGPFLAITGIERLLIKSQV